jgi:hypothetical protein
MSATVRWIRALVAVAVMAPVMYFGAPAAYRVVGLGASFLVMVLAILLALFVAGPEDREP